MATFVKREARRKMVWLVRVRRKGHPPLAQTFERQKDGEAWAAQMEAAISEERAVPGRLARRHTLTEAIARYKATKLPQKRWSTARNQVKQLAWWEQRLGQKRLADITPASIAEHQDTLLKQCRAATVVRYLAVLSHLFAVAMKEWQWVESNPVERVGKPSEPPGRDRFLREEE